MQMCTTQGSRTNTISGNFSFRICPKAHSFIATRHGNVINCCWIFFWSNVLIGLLIFHQCYKLLKYTIFVKHIQNRSTKEPRDDPTMSNVPGGPSSWGRSTLHLRSLFLQAFALSTTFAARLLCLWWEKGEHWDELIGNLITSEIKAEAVQHLDLGVEERNPGSFHPSTNAGSLVIEDCERWNGFLTDDYNSLAIN